MTAGSFVRRWWFAGVAALLVLLLWPERGYVAIWDGHVYLTCVVDAAAHGITLDALRCGEHPSQLYMGLLALSQLPEPGNTGALLIANSLLGALALWALGDLLSRLLPGESWWPDRALLLTIVAIHPVVLATLVQVNPDFGVYAFFLMALSHLAARRYGWAALAGVFLCFSKETGALVYFVALALHVVSRFLGEEEGSWKRFAHIAPPAAVAATPLAAYAGFLWWWGASRQTSALWNPGIHSQPLDAFRWFDFESITLRSSLAIIFVLGFMWLPAAALVADFAVGIRRTLLRLSDRGLDGVNGRLAGYMTALTAALVYVLTSYRTWSNPRYFVVLVPLLIVAGFVAVVRLRAAPVFRRAGLAVVGVLLLASEHRSWDPVSRALFGTFSVGPAEMYRVAGITHEFGGRGIDQLGYNLQFTGFHHAQNAVFAALRPSDTTAIVFPRRVNWLVASPLDARTFARSAALTGTVTPRYMDESELAKLPEPLPRELWYLDLANNPDTLAILSLHRKYEDVGSQSYTARSHTIAVRHLVRREPAVVP